MCVCGLSDYHFLLFVSYTREVRVGTRVESKHQMRKPQCCKEYLWDLKIERQPHAKTKQQQQQQQATAEKTTNNKTNSKTT